MSQKLILFDMDGVIFEGKNFWLELHQIMGTEKQAWELWSGLARTDYHRLSHLTAMNLWRNKPAKEFSRLINRRKTTDGIASVFDYLHENNIKSAIISSGPYQLAERARQLFGIDEIRANKLEIGANGCFTGAVDVQVNDNTKGISAADIMKKLGAAPHSTAMIGDTISDVSVAKMVGLQIAYNTTEKALLDACKYHLRSGQIHKVVDILKLENF